MKKNTKYTKKQILESIKYWKKELNRIDESLRVSLADKQSATKALLDHNDELTAFIDQKPRPTRDEIIQYVADIFKEEGLDTPWTRQFLIKLKMYTHGWNDLVQYLWNARLKGQQLSMDQGIRPKMDEDEEFKPDKYFIQLFKCNADGEIDHDYDLVSGGTTGEIKYLLDKYGINQMFNTKSEAMQKARRVSKQMNIDFENAADPIEQSEDNMHGLAVVRQGDDWGSNAVACFIDGKMSPLATVSSQFQLDESHPPMDDYLDDTGTHGSNQRDILAKTFKSYGPGYSADAFVAFTRELASQDPMTAKKLRQFFGQFASGSLDDKYWAYAETGNCVDIAKSLVAMLAAALAER